MAGRQSSSYRKLNALGFLTCSAAMIYTLTNAVPAEAVSPLCSLTRLLLMTLGSLFLLSLLHNPRQTGQRIYAFFKLTLIGGGIYAAGYHLWLSAAEVPPTVPASCSQPVAEILADNPSGLIPTLFDRAVTCPTEEVVLLGMGVAEQSLLFFVLLFLLNWVLLTKRQKPEGLFL